MTYLLDTCGVSERMKAAPDRNVLEWLSSVDEESLFISAVTIGEIRKGVALLGETKRATQLSELLDVLESEYSDRRLSYDVSAACRTCGAPRWRMPGSVRRTKPISAATRARRRQRSSATTRRMTAACSILTPSSRPWRRPLWRPARNTCRTEPSGWLRWAARPADARRGTRL